MSDRPANGSGNPEPVFLCESLSVDEVRVLADRRGAGPGHLKLRLRDAAEALDAVAFGMGGSAPAAGARVQAAVQLGVDAYFGAERVQLKVKGLRETDGRSAGD